MISKKTLKEIADTIIDHGYEEDNAALYIFTDGSWQIRVDKPKTDIFHFMIPSYDEEPFVEDKKMALMLDLSQAYNEWISRAPQREAAKKTNEILKKKNPNHYREAAKKRWNK